MEILEKTRQRKGAGFRAAHPSLCLDNPSPHSVEPADLSADAARGTSALSKRTILFLDSGLVRRRSGGAQVRCLNGSGPKFPFSRLLKNKVR